MRMRVLVNVGKMSLSDSAAKGANSTTIGASRMGANNHSNLTGASNSSPMGGLLGASDSSRSTNEAAHRQSSYLQSSATCGRNVKQNTSRFWAEKGAWKHREKHVVFFSAVDFLAQVHKV